MTRYCSQCGTPNKPGNRFCKGCGRPMYPQAQKTQPITQQTSQYIQSPSPHQRTTQFSRASLPIATYPNRARSYQPYSRINMYPWYSSESNSRLFRLASIVGGYCIIGVLWIWFTIPLWLFFEKKAEDKKKKYIINAFNDKTTFNLPTLAKITKKQQGEIQQILIFEKLQDFHLPWKNSHDWEMRCRSASLLGMAIILGIYWIWATLPLWFFFRYLTGKKRDSFFHSLSGYGPNELSNLSQTAGIPASLILLGNKAVNSTKKDPGWISSNRFLDVIKYFTLTFGVLLVLGYFTTGTQYSLLILVILGILIPLWYSHRNSVRKIEYKIWERSSFEFENSIGQTIQEILDVISSKFQELNRIRSIEELSLIETDLVEKKQRLETIQASVTSSGNKSIENSYSRAKNTINELNKAIDITKDKILLTGRILAGLTELTPGEEVSVEQIARATSNNAQKCWDLLIELNEENRLPEGKFNKFSGKYTKGDVSFIHAGPISMPVVRTCYQCGQPLDEDQTDCPDCGSKVENCQVCRRILNFGDEIAVCPFCDSKYHYSHLLEWVKINGNCPICKNGLNETTVLNLPSPTDFKKKFK